MQLKMLTKQVLTADATSSSVYTEPCLQGMNWRASDHELEVGVSEYRRNHDHMGEFTWRPCKIRITSQLIEILHLLKITNHSLQHCPSFSFLEQVEHGNMGTFR